MFSAIQMSKAGMWFSENYAERGWRRSIRIEDTVTAVVFDAASGLRGELFAPVINKLRELIKKAKPPEKKSEQA